MTQRARPQRILIASSHALFGQGLRSLLLARQKAEVEVVGMVSSLGEALAAIDVLNPDLVIVDYDDQALNREEFLARFVGSEKKLRVVLLSLQNPEEAIVYDRRTMAAAQIDRWLEEWPTEEEAEAPPPPSGGGPLSANRLRRNTMKHLIIAGIFVVLVTVLLIVGMDTAGLLPEQASLQAIPIDSMFDLEFKVIYFLFALIVVFMVYSIVVFRRKPGDTSDARHVEGNTKLEVTWTLIPLVTVLTFSFLGAQSLAETQAIGDSVMEVNVIGSQWAWRFEYPDTGIVSNELRLPVGKQALLHLQSTDVIHSFWVPEFRVKQDALPGGEEFIRDLRVTPTKIGEYKVRCAELCGLNHAYMEAPVIVMAEADYKDWEIAESGLSPDPVVRGQKWYENYGCNACHTLDGTIKVGPSWKGLYGSQAKFTDGTTAVADDAYIYESIRNPGAKTVEGFTPGLMPQNIAEKMSDDQISDVIEFIKTLK
ncbi:MAG TPA: cytochrome c oxidase subunit II [Anaerolineales bacterium]